jgi:hypothetical protein
MSPTGFTSVLRRTRDEAQSPALRGTAANNVRARWREVLRTVRPETERRAALLSAEDPQVQSMPDPSPNQVASRTRDLVLRAVPARARARFCSIPPTSPPVRATRGRSEA